MNLSNYLSLGFKYILIYLIIIIYYFHPKRQFSPPPLLLLPLLSLLLFPIMTTSLNPNADPFLYTMPFVSPPKPQFSPIPIYKTPPTLILAPPLHGYGAPNYVAHPMFGLLSYDVVPQVASSWPCSDGLCSGGGERKYCKIKKWVPRLRFRVGDETTLQFQSPLQLLPSETQTTTLMIKNIPNQFRSFHFSFFLYTVLVFSSKIILFFFFFALLSIFSHLKTRKMWAKN